MDFLTLVLGLVETGALLAALMFATVAMKAKKEDPSRKGYLRRAGIYIGIYLVLNVLRNFVF